MSRRLTIEGLLRLRPELAMTWEIFEESQRRYRQSQDQLTEKALAELERRGFEIRGKSLADLKDWIEGRSKKPGDAKEDGDP